MLDRRIGLFLSLPLATLEDMAIKREIGQTRLFAMAAPIPRLAPVTIATRPYRI